MSAIADLVLPFLDRFGGQTLAALAGVALVAGLARGFSGFGAALIFMPVASALIGPKLAAVTLFFSDAVMGLAMVPPALRIADRREAATMALGTALGAPLGTAVLAYADPLTVRWIVVGLVGAMFTLLLSGWRYQGEPSPPLTIGTGFVGGLSGGAAQVGGPPVVAYWLGGQKDVARIRANIVVYFALGSVITAVNYGLAGILDLTGAGLALIVGPVYGLGLSCGTRLFGRADDALFRRICLGLIGAALVIGLPLFDGLRS